MTKKTTSEADVVSVNDEPDPLKAVDATEADDAPEVQDKPVALSASEKAKRWDAVAPLIEPLLEKYGSVDAVQAAADQHAQEVTALRDAQDVNAISKRLHDKVSSGNLSPDAYQERLRYEVLASRIYRNELANAMSAAKAKYPLMDEELVQTVSARPEQVMALAAHTHKRTAKVSADAERRAVGQYIAAKAKAADTAPEPGRGDAPVTTGADYKPKGSFSKWLTGKSV